MKKISRGSIILLIMAAASFICVCYNNFLLENRWGWNTRPLYLVLSGLAVPLYQFSAMAGFVSLLLDCLGWRRGSGKWRKLMWIIPLVLAVFYLAIFCGVYWPGYLWCLNAVTFLSNSGVFVPLGVLFAFGIGGRKRT